MVIDLNADVGEGMETDAQLIPLISSANIACGYHAGDEATMLATMKLCVQHGVAIGAHPSFADRENFGRTEMPWTEDTLYPQMQIQILMASALAKLAGGRLTHVKPHGALYNMSARESRLARCIARAVYDADASLVLVGLAGSASVHEAEMQGLRAVHEFFADRTYQSDGSLTPRSHANAIIASADAALEQAMRIVRHGEIVAADGTLCRLSVSDNRSICLHGDGPHAIAFAQTIRQAFEQAGIIVKSTV